MSNVDTSSYPKAAFPKSAIEVAKDFVGLEQAKTNIDRTKLELAIRNQDQLLRQLQGIDPATANAETIRKQLQYSVKMKLITPDQYAVEATNIPNDPAKVQDYLKNKMAQAQSINDALNWQYGQMSAIQTGAGVQPTVIRGRDQTTYSAGPMIPNQLPPTTQEIGPDNKTRLRGVVSTPPNELNLPPNPLQRPNPLPVAPPQMPNSGPLPVKPGMSNNLGGNVIAAEAEQPTINTFAQRFPSSQPVVAREPGAAEAEVATGRQSGEALAAARQRAMTYAQDMFPVTEALNAAKNLGTKGVGPGSESVNYLKSFILTNIPGIKDTDPEFDKINDFDKLQKYLVQIAKTSGNTTTNDQLAASFAGNPNVKMSNASVQDVLASIKALRSLDLAKTKMWEQQNLSENQFAKWSSQWDNNIDPRAFGILDMRPEAIVKLDKSLKGKAREKFNNSLKIARDIGFM